ncbi:MAG: T9SS type A sorting domain-containing protein [Candidatus Latescibacteria bacterium]|nr:T9SS type A sorting domain-containing protein [Candidatus Latescibacterota bacterium]
MKSIRGLVFVLVSIVHLASIYADGTVDSIPTPELLLPADMEFVKAGTEYTFTWEQVPNASEYEIQFSDSENFGNAEEFSTTTTSINHTTNENFRRESPAYWRVRAIIGGNTGDWSASGSYYTQAWVHYTTADDLVHNEVNAIAADPDGGAWIGTSGGISFYDGKKWSDYTIKEGLVHNHVTALVFDKDGELWVGTIGGVSNYNGSEWINHTVYNGLIDGTVYGLKVAPDNKVWITTTRTVSSFDGKIWTHYLFDAQFTGLEEMFHNKREIAISPDGDIWVVSPNHGVIMYDGFSWYSCDTQNIAPASHITGLDITPDGKVWISFWGPYYSSYGGIAWYDGNQWNTESSDLTIQGLTAAPDGTVWFSGHYHHGVWSYTDNTWTLKDEKKVGWSDVLAFDTDGLFYASAGDFTPPMEDIPYKNGLWIYDGYKNQYDPEPPGETIRGNFSEIIEPEIMTGNITSVDGITRISPEGRWTKYDIGSVRNYIHDSEMIWCATDRGVVRFDTSDNSYMSIGGPEGSIAVTQDGKVWIGQGKVYCWDGRAWSGDLTRSDEYEGGPWGRLGYSLHFHGIFPCSDNSLYMAIAVRMWKYDNNTWESYVKLNAAETYEVDYNDTIWQPAKNGVMSYSNGTWTTHELPLGEYNFVISIQASADNNIWVDVLESGAFSYDGETWTEYNAEEKTLAYYSVMAHNGVFWTGDSEGLHRLELTSSEIDEDNDVPKEFTLFQNSPNPFNPSTTISFSLLESHLTTLTVYNISGQKIRELAADYKTAGTHTVQWDGRDDSGRTVSSGIYITRLKSGSYVASKNMLLMK